MKKMNLKRIVVTGLSLATILTMSLSVHAREASDYSRNYTDDGAIRTMGSIQANYTDDKNYFSTVLATNRFDKVGETEATIPTKMDLTAKMTCLGIEVEVSRTESEYDWPIATGYITDELSFEDEDCIWCITGEYTSYFPEVGYYLNPPNTNLSMGG